MNFERENSSLLKFYESSGLQRNGNSDKEHQVLAVLVGASAGALIGHLAERCGQLVIVGDRQNCEQHSFFSSLKEGVLFLLLALVSLRGIPPARARGDRAL